MVLPKSKSDTSAKSNGSISNNTRSDLNPGRDHEANGKPFQPLPSDSSEFILRPMPPPEHEICSMCWIKETGLINDAMITRMSSQISRLAARECSQSNIDPKEFTLSPMPHPEHEVAVMRWSMETARRSFTLLSKAWSVISKMEKCRLFLDSGEFTLPPMSPPEDLIASRRWNMETHCITNVMLHRML